MQITVNGVATSVADGTSVASLVDSQTTEPRRVAVAVNAEVVPRSQWHLAPVEPGDSIELLTAAAGG